LLYFWLSSPKIAIERVAKRVSKGGHNIPIEVIERRYYRGLNNLYQMYMPICNEWTLIDNMDLVPEVIAKSDSFGKAIFNDELWDIIIQQSHEKR
jgi:predicted ABC-type ATPase